MVSARRERVGRFVVAAALASGLGYVVAGLWVVAVARDPMLLLAGAFTVALAGLAIRGHRRTQAGRAPEG